RPRQPRINGVSGSGVPPRLKDTQSKGLVRSAVVGGANDLFHPIGLFFLYIFILSCFVRPLGYCYLCLLALASCINFFSVLGLGCLFFHHYCYPYLRALPSCITIFPSRV